MNTGTDVAGYEEERLLLKRYLSDEIAPMIFANSASDIFRIPPQVVATEIHSWIGDQIRGTSNMTAAELIYHAATKIHQLGILELIPKDEIVGFLGTLQPHLISICPADQQAGLQENFAHLAKSTSLGGSQVEVLRRRDGGSGGGSGGGGGLAAPDARGGSSIDPAALSGVTPPAAPPGAASGPQVAADPAALKRLNLLLDRLQTMDPPAEAASAPVPGQAASSNTELLAHVVEQVAAQSGSSKEFETQLDFLKDMGIEAVSSEIIQMLSQALPDWAAPARSESDASSVEPTASAARAMGKVIELSRDRDELGRRYKELVSVAITECNEGSLGRAVTMLDLADRMVTQSKVNSEVAAAVVEQAYPELDKRVLYRYGDEIDKRSLLRRLMIFFPELRVEPLLDEFKGEQDLEKRLDIVKLLLAHGEEARAEAVYALDESVHGGERQPWYVERNLLYLMRSIPRTSDEHLDHEIDLLIQTSDFNSPVPLVRESIASLVSIDHHRAYSTLDARITDLEDTLLGTLDIPMDPKDIRWLISFALKKLCQNSSAQARAIVINHGLKGDQELGDTYGRLAALEAQDLSDTPDQLARILDALRKELPRRILGVSVKNQRRAQIIEHLITAVSGTDALEVRKTLEDIVKKYGDQSFARAAESALSQGDGRPAPRSAPIDDQSVTLQGDLSLFGLPNLLQNLSASGLAGTISIFDSGGDKIAEIEIDQNILVSANYGKLEDDVAIYQLLELPVAGRFDFKVTDEEARGARTKAGHAVTSLLLEGMRRYDELHRALVLIPDGSRYKPTGMKPSDVQGIGDPKLATSVWSRASRGTPPEEVETEANLDSFRIRRLYEHWVTEGSLARADEQPAS